MDDMSETPDPGLLDSGPGLVGVFGCSGCPSGLTIDSSGSTVASDMGVAGSTVFDAGF